MTAHLRHWWILASILLSLSALLVPSSAQLKVYAETEVKVEPENGRDPSSFVVIVCNVEPVNTTVPTRWVMPHGEIVSQSSGRYRIGQGDNGKGVWSTILAIQNVSYQDAGHYTCEVVPSSISRSQCECVDFPFSATTELQLQVSLVAIKSVVNTTEGSMDSTQLACEMKGFLRPDDDLSWYKDGHPISLNGTGYSVAVKEGTVGAGQFGENQTVHSRLFILNINNPTVADTGVYSCKIHGSDVEASMSLTVSRATPDGPVTDMPSPSSKGQGTDGRVGVAASEKPPRGNNFDGKNGRDLTGGSSETGLTPSCPLDGGEVAIIVGTTCIITAVLSSLLTLLVTCFCVSRKQQVKQSKNRTELVPSLSRDNRQEVDSTYSVITSANIGTTERNGNPQLTDNKHS